MEVGVVHTSKFSFVSSVLRAKTKGKHVWLGHCIPQGRGCLSQPFRCFSLVLEFDLDQRYA